MDSMIVPSSSVVPPEEEGVGDVEEKLEADVEAFGEPVFAVCWDSQYFQPKKKKPAINTSRKRSLI